MQINLVVVKGDGSMKAVPVKSLPVTIGRGEDADLRLPVQNVSRRHAELFEDDEELMIRDLGSSNGTYVNGQRITGEIDLTPGDLVAIGPAVLVIQIDGNPKDIDAMESFAAGAVVDLGEVSFDDDAPARPKTRADAPAKPQAAPPQQKPAQQPPAKGRGDDDDEGDLDSLLADLDFSELDEDEDKN